MIIRNVLVLCALVLSFSHLYAANPYAGQYGGYVYESDSGGAEYIASNVNLQIDETGRISGLWASSALFSGAVDDAGTFTLVTPNTYHITNGVITSGALGGTGTFSSSSYRLDLHFQEGNFVGGGQLLWRATPTTSKYYFNAVTYGNGRFVAVGSAGLVATSTDGTNWAIPAVTGRRDWKDVAYGNNVFLAVGTNSVVTSPDGADWTMRATNTFVSTAFGNGLFLAVDLTGAVYSSTDGSAWSVVAGAATAQSFTTVDYAHNLFILCGSKGSFQTSADGVNWNPTCTNGTTALYAAASSNGRWIIGGKTRFVIFNNATGSDQVTTNISAGYDALSLAADESIPVGGGDLLVAATSMTGRPPAYSTNGPGWFYANGLADTIRGVAWGTNHVFVAVGNDIQSSTDGAAWTIRTPVLPIAVPNNTDGSSFGLYNDQMTFTDLQNRRREVRVGQGGRIEMRFLDATNGAKDFVAVVSPTTNTLRRVMQFSSPPVALGDLGTIVQWDMTNLVWKTIASPTSANIYDAFRSSVVSLYVAVGAGGLVMTAPTSSNGTNWTIRSSGTINDLYSVNEGSLTSGNLIFAAGDNGTIVASSNGGTTWGARLTGTVTNRLTRVYKGDYTGTFYALPQSGRFLLASTNDGVAWKLAPLGNPFPVSTSAVRGGNAGQTEGGYVFTLQSGKFTPSLAGYDKVPGGYYTPPTPPTLISGAYGNGRYVLLGGTNTAVSADGVRWQAGHTEPGYRFGGTTKALTFGHGLFVAVGGIGLVESSLDGINWTIRNTGITNSSDFTSVSYGNGRFVAVGGGGTVFSSTNGLDWEDDSFSNSGGSVGPVYYGNGRFVALVFKLGGTYATRYSSNGVDWVNGSVGSGMNALLGFANGRFFGANGSAILSSTNGTAWSGTSAGVFFNSANQIAYGGGRYVVTCSPDSSSADGATVLSSANLTNWFAETIASSGSYSPVIPNGILAGQGQFVIYGDKGAVLTAAYAESGSAPLITVHPAPVSQKVGSGATVSYSASATGDGPLTYGWLKDGLPLNDGPGISGSSTTTLTLSGVTTNSAGNYQFTVANNVGSDLSQIASLLVDTNAAATYNFSSWINGYNLPKGQNGPNDDPDNDGLKNLVEYAFGTDPTAGTNKTPTFVWQNIGGTNYPAVQFTRNPQATDVSVTPLISTNLTFGSLVGSSQSSSNQPGGLNLVMVRSTEPIGTYPSLFFKINVTQP